MCLRRTLHREGQTVIGGPALELTQVPRRFCLAPVRKDRRELRLGGVAITRAVSPEQELGLLSDGDPLRDADWFPDHAASGWKPVGDPMSRLSDSIADLLNGDLDRVAAGRYSSRTRERQAPSADRGRRPRYSGGGRDKCGRSRLGSRPGHARRSVRRGVPAQGEAVSTDRVPEWRADASNPRTKLGLSRR